MSHFFMPFDEVNWFIPFYGVNNLTIISMAFDIYPIIPFVYFNGVIKKVIRVGIMF